MDLTRVCYGCFREKRDAASVCPHCGCSAAVVQPFPALPPGTILRGRYLTGRVLGMGGFGITYLGYDLVLEIRVAVKEYLPVGLATRHADGHQVVLTGRQRADYERGRSRFLEEARILARLQGTPHIVSVQDHFPENGTAYFVMEYVDGMSLKAFLAAQGGRIPCGQALTILTPVMEALTRVHALGLIHRDISPDNLFLTAAGESKLLDFGAARCSAEDGRSVSVILKHGFAPEEQYASHGSQGPWTDVYAMGATLYRCVTGQLPPDAIARVRRDTLQRPSELGVSLPPGLEAAMAKAMAVRAEDRFPTMEAFLQAVAGGDGGAKTRVETRRGGSAKGRPPAARLLTAAALVICAAAIGLGVWRLTAGPGSPADTQAAAPPVSAPDAQTPGDSAADPDGTADPDDAARDYVSAALNCSITLPAAYAETAPGSAAFVSSSGSCSLQLGYYTYWSGFPVYELADVEANADTYVAYFVGLLQSTDVTDYRILQADYRQIGECAAYQVQFEATERGGSTMRFLAAFLEGQNGFGCYNVIASYPQGDAAAEAALLASLETFRCLGPAGTGYKLFSDAALSFRFLYEDSAPPLEFEIGDDLVTALSASGSDYASLTVSAVPLAGLETAAQLLSRTTEDLDALYPGIEARSGPETQVRGGMEWAVRAYVQDREGTAVYLSYSAAVWQNQGYLIILTSNQEAQLEDNGLRADVMGSLRPAA